MVLLYMGQLVCNYKIKFTLIKELAVVIGNGDSLPHSVGIGEMALPDGNNIDATKRNIGLFCHRKGTLIEFTGFYSLQFHTLGYPEPRN